MKTKHWIIAVHCATWFLFVLIHTLLIGSGSLDAVSFWNSPVAYLSTWITDLYLIALFYFNYSFVSLRFFRHKMFAAYALFVGVASLLGLFFPIILNSFWQVGIPSAPMGPVGLSVWGFLGALCLLSVGLSIRAIRQWIDLEALCKKQKEAIAQHNDLIREKDTQIAALQNLAKGAVGGETSTGLSSSSELTRHF